MMEITPQDIDQAFDAGSFRPYFQPLVSLQNRALYGFELLARWQHAKHGWIAPDIFIPWAERDGWIKRLSETLFRSAFRTMATLEETLTLSVNVSPVQLHQPDLPQTLSKLAGETGFSLNRLIVEITESGLLEELDQVRVTVSALKEMGCRLALDDFGTGHSSLTHLQSLPFDELKVDRSFVSTMTDRRDSRKIVAAVVGLGRSLGMITVAEGVETHEQTEMLHWLGCDLAQGLLYGEPVCGEDLSAIINARTNKVSTPPMQFAGRGFPGKVDILYSLRLAQLQAIYDGAPVALALLDRDLRHRALNQRLAILNGKPLEDHIGKRVSEIIPDIFPAIEGDLLRALDGHAVEGVELTGTAPFSNQSRTLLISYQPARDEADEVIGVSVAIMDITAQKRAEQARDESHESFRQMMELLPQIPWIIDPDGRALDVSQRWLELTGMTQDEWQGFGWLNALHPDDVQPTWDAMRKSFATRQPIDLFYRVRTSEKAPWTRLRSRGAARIDTKDGAILCWYGCLEKVQDNASS